MKRYDVIIIGATFCALGAMDAANNNGLILERRSDICYEFINSYKYSGGAEGIHCNLLLDMEEKGVSPAFMPETLPFLYHRLLERSIPLLLMTEIINVERRGDYFVVDVYNAEGFGQFGAKKILDTTHGLSLPTERRPKIVAKSFNALLWNADTQTEISFERDDFCITPTCKSSMAILKMKVDTNAAMSEVLCPLNKLWTDVRGQFENYKIANTANCFDITTDATLYPVSDNYCVLASCSFSNPFEAYNAGERHMGGGIH